jgi:hypothetical protein
MKKKRQRKFTIDWPNHTIAFFSALFGILIAFELDEWREQQSKKEMASKAYERMMEEVQFNHDMLQANLTENVERMRVLDKLLSNLNDRLLFTGSLSLADSFNSIYSHYIYIDTSDRSGNGIYPANIVVASLTMMNQHTSAWESAKATGVLNFMEYEKVIALSSVYTNQTITEELAVIRQLTKQADEITSKHELEKYLEEVQESLEIIARELAVYNQFVRILQSLQSD